VRRFKFGQIRPPVVRHKSVESIKEDQVAIAKINNERNMIWF
jgi:hypothetical protein